MWPLGMLPLQQPRLGMRGGAPVIRRDENWRETRGIRSKDKKLETMKRKYDKEKKSAAELLGKEKKKRKAAENKLKEARKAADKELKEMRKKMTWETSKLKEVRKKMTRERSNIVANIKIKKNKTANTKKKVCLLS